MKRGLKKGKKVKIFELINTESEEITKLDSTKVKEKSCKQKKNTRAGVKELEKRKKNMFRKKKCEINVSHRQSSEHKVS
jgi:hypothetical protein